MSEEEGDWGGEGVSSSVVVCKSVVCEEFAVWIGESGSVEVVELEVRVWSSFESESWVA